MKTFAISIILMSLLFQPQSFGAELTCDQILGDESSIESSVTFENGAYSVEGRRKFFSQYKWGANPDYSRRQYESVFSIKAFKPKYGVGQLLEIKYKHIRSGGRGLWDTTIRFPKFFAKFDLYADENRLIMPDSERLSSLTTNGFKVRDLTEQIYTQTTFHRYFQEGYIPMATKGEWFSHDRLGEHMLGGLVIPKRLFEKFGRYVIFEAEVLKAFPADARRAINLDGAAFGSHASDNFWDQISAGFGNSVLALHQTVTKRQLLNLADWILRVDQMLITGARSILAQRISTIHESTSTSSDFQQAVSQFDKKSPSLDITENQAVDEAIELAHEITGNSVDDLRALLK